MAASLLVGEALPARARPDASEAPSGRIEAGTEVGELERIGDWVRVEAPSGDRWWVDGRRLTALDVAATRVAPSGVKASQPPPASSGPPPTMPPPDMPPADQPIAQPTPSGPPEPVATAEQQVVPATPSGPNDERPTRRFPRVLVGVVLVAVVLAGIGAVLLLRRAEPTDPEVLRGWFALEDAPDLVVSGDIDRRLYLVSDGAVTVGQHDDDDFTLATDQVPELDDVTAAVGNWSRSGVTVLTSEPAVLALYDTPSYELDYEDNPIETVDRVALPPGEYAPVMAGEWIGSTVFVFPERQGRSDSFLAVDPESGDVDEYPLGQNVEVVSAVQHFEYLYVGHATGVLTVFWSIKDDPSDPRGYSECAHPVGNFELIDPALARVERTPHDPSHSVVALDRERAALHVIDWEGVREEMGPCGGDFPTPYVMGTIDVGSVDAGASVATLGNVAYVLTAGDLLRVDVTDPADARGGRVESMWIPKGDTGGAAVGIALQSTTESDVYQAFVADGQRLWWIAPEGPEGRDQLDPATVEMGG